MNENYVELLVPRKTAGWQKGMVWLLLLLAISSLIFYFPASLATSPMSLLALVGAVLFGVLFWVMRTNVDVEYEYLYVGKELSVDKILGKAKRKNVLVLDMERVEMIAPQGSYHLDEFKNKTYRLEDYTSQEEGAKVYVMITDSSKVLIEPNDELIKLFRNTVPRKIFTD